LTLSNAQKILLKNYPRKFQAFLSVRDYGIDNEADQLIKMYKIFGKKHAACTAIWQGLFIKEAGAPRTRTKHEAPQWALYMIHLLRLEHLWDQVVSCMGLDGKLLELNERHESWPKGSAFCKPVVEVLQNKSLFRGVVYVLLTSNTCSVPPFIISKIVVVAAY